MGHKKYTGDPGPITCGLLGAIEDSGLSIAEIARRAHMHPSRLYHFCDGRTLDLMEVDRIAKAIGLELAWSVPQPPDENSGEALSS